MTSFKNDWTQAATNQGLVSIGTHCLYISAAGPPRIGSEPVVIIECGHGDSSDAWPAAVQAISTFARVYNYDRAGYGKSEASPTTRNSTNIAAELSALLEAIDVKPPYVLVVFSYGGILIREFFATRPEDCVGLVLVDTVQEDDRLYEWPYEDLFALKGDMDRHEVIGLTATTKLTPEEWKEFKRVNALTSHNATGELEEAEILPSAMKLNKKKQFAKCAFGDRPVSVIKADHARDWRRVQEAGEKAGNGTPEQRERLKTIVDGLDEMWERNQKRQLDLSRRSRMVYARESGHQVAQQQPELLAREVKWVLDLL
jgi:pimeloyl-ACP methyl ester carboxylesterase